MTGQCKVNVGGAKKKGCVSCLCGEAARAGHAYKLVRKRDRKIPVASAKLLIDSPPSLMHVIA